MWFLYFYYPTCVIRVISINVIVIGFVVLISLGRHSAVGSGHIANSVCELAQRATDRLRAMTGRSLLTETKPRKKKEYIRNYEIYK